MTSFDDEPEPFGTTSIPIGNRPLSLTFDEAKMGESFFGANNGMTIAQQPQTQAFATYEASKNENLDPLMTLNGSLIDVNPHFVVYALKNGLIRVLHRQSAMRALLRGHSNQVITDITFFHDGDTVATVGNDPKTGKSTLIVWRVYEKPPEIGSERLLEITNLGYGGAPDLTMSRLIWHPFNPNQFWMTHSTSSSKQVATLVETTRIQTKLVVFKDPKEKNPQQHAACQWHSPYCVMENALQLKEQDSPSADGQLVDLCWSGKNPNNVMTVHKNGSIILWDLKERDSGASSDDDYSDDGSSSSILPKKLYYLKDVGSDHSRCMFLPHEQSVGLYADKSIESVTTCFVTAAATNSKVTIWSSFAKRRIPGNDTGAFLPVNPVKLQEIDLHGHTNSPSSFVMDVCFGPANLSEQPPSSFLLLGSRDTGRLYALHVRSEWSKNDGSESGNNNNMRAPLCSGIDYLVPFSLKHPVYSWSVICGPTQDVHEDDDPATSGSGFDIKAFAYQSKAVQCLTVTNNMTLPPKNSSSNSNSTGGIYTVENLEGPCVAPPSASATATATATVTANDSCDSNEPVAYDEEEYDVDDEDDDGDEAAAAASAPASSEVAAPPAAPAAGGLFPGAPNPFANWLGAIAGSANGAPDGGSSESNVADALPTPPAPSDLPMPPGITPSTTPPLPGILAPPPGMVVPPTPVSTTPATGAETTVTEDFLNPLELLAKSMGNTNLTDGSSPSNKEKNNNVRKNKNKSPKRIINKSPRRSQSPKPPPKKGNSKGNSNTKNKSPFPDGKVTILKRASDTIATPPLLANPSVLSDSVLLGAAGIPVPPPVVSDPAILAALQQPATPVFDPAMLKEQVRKAVEEAVSATVVPAVKKSIKDSFVTLARPLQNSMNELGKKGVSVDPDDLRKALDVDTPLNAAFATNIKNVLVPSLQSITGQILQQVEASMPKPPPSPPKDESKQLLGLLVQQFQAMATKMDALSAEVQGLRKQVSEQTAAQLQAVAAAAAAAQQRKASSEGGSPEQVNNNSNTTTENNEIQIRHQIDALLSKGKYEEAFTKAIATTTPQTAVYCCARSDVRVVLSDHSKPPVLSSPILICLMQQLSAALAGTQSAQEMQIELGWLQEIALTMNPTDPSIVQHVPKVLKQLVANVNSRLLLEGNGHFRRPLQMLLQSLMGMQLAVGK